MSKKSINITMNLLKKQLIEEPSVDFTEQIMRKINAQEKSKSIIYKPIISKKAFGFIILSVIIFLIVLLNLPSNYFNSPYTEFLIQISDIYKNILASINFSFLNKIPTIIPTIIISGWILFFSDLLIIKIMNRKITSE